MKGRITRMDCDVCVKIEGTLKMLWMVKGYREVCGVFARRGGAGKIEVGYRPSLLEFSTSFLFRTDTSRLVGMP
jgi:hypothetical protein